MQPSVAMLMSLDTSFLTVSRLPICSDLLKLESGQRNIMRTVLCCFVYWSCSLSWAHSYLRLLRGTRASWFSSGSVCVFFVFFLFVCCKVSFCVFSLGCKSLCQYQCGQLPGKIDPYEMTYRLLSSSNSSSFIQPGGRETT